MATVVVTTNYGIKADYSSNHHSNSNVANGGDSFSSYIGEGDETHADSNSTFPISGTPLIKRLLDAATIAQGIAPVTVAELQTETDTLAAALDESQAAEDTSETIYNPGDESDDPRLHTYATVTVDGAVVAVVDNQGVVFSSDEDYEKYADSLADEVNGTNGPDLAQLRAEQVASALGGTVDIADTALTQSQFEALS